nr:MAG TPA: helix-turn-helix domain protein [Caudoviricetes sp.]
MNKKHISDENYILIQGWMRTEMGLSGAALMVYATIYGFSQTGNCYYSGSIDYLAEWAGVKRRQVISILKDLTESGYIEKNEVGYNRFRYRTDREMVRNARREWCKNDTIDGAKMTPDGAKMTHNKYIYNTNNNNNINTHTAGAREESAEAVENFTTSGAVPLPEEKNDRAEAATILCGPNKNVKLTPAQLEELENRIPNQITRYIHRLGRYKVGRANAAMMDDYQWLLGWISEDGAIHKERELEAIRQAEAEEDRRELEEMQRRILEKKRKGRADLCG